MDLFDDTPSIGDGEFNNLFSMMDSIRTIEKKVVDVDKYISNSFKSSPIVIKVDDKQFDKFTSIFGGANTILTPSNPTQGSVRLNNLTRDDRAFLTQLFERNNISDEVEEATSDIRDSLDDVTREVRRGNQSSSNGDLSVILKSVGTALLSLIGSAINTGVTRAYSEFKAMDEARNDIMYRYGLQNTKEGRDKADEIYLKRFLHEAEPYQKRTAPEWRQFYRENRLSALGMGFNTTESLNNVTNQLNKWKETFEDINFESSELFKNTIRFVDTSGKSFDTIMTHVEQLSTQYIVTPNLLEQVSSGYSKYLRIITKNNNAYVKSMNNLMTSVAKLEDAGVDALSYYDGIEQFMYSDITNAANSNMWQRLSVLGYSPSDILYNKTPDEAFDLYTQGLKRYFSSYDLSNSMDRQRVNTLAQQVFGFSVSEMPELYSLLKSDESGSGGKGTVNDYKEKVAIDADRYYDVATAGWTYLTESQKFQDSISASILGNPELKRYYEEWENFTKGMIDLPSVVSNIVAFLTGGALLNTIKSALGFGSNGLFSSAGSAAAGAGAASGANTIAKLFGTGTKMGTLSPFLAAGGFLWGGVNAYQGVNNYNNLMGIDASLQGQIASGIGGFLGGNSGYGWDDANKSTLEKAGDTFGNAAKGAMIGALAGPIGMAIGGVIGAGFAAVGGDAISELLMDQNTLVNKRRRESMILEKRRSEAQTELTNQLIVSQNVQYESSDNVIKALNDNNKSLSDNQLSISRSLSDYGFTDEVKRDIVAEYTSTNDLDASLNKYGFTEEVKNQIKTEIDNGSSLNDILGLDDDNMRKILKILNENAAKIVENTGADTGIYYDKLGVAHAAFKYDKGSQIDTAMLGVARQMGLSKSQYESMSDYALQYAGERATYWGTVGRQFNNNELATDVMDTLLKDPDSPYYGLVQSAVVNETESSSSSLPRASNVSSTPELVGYAYSGLGNTLYNLGAFGETPEYYNNNPQIPYVTDAFWSEYINRHKVGDDTSSTPMDAADLSELERAKKILPVIGNSNKFFIIFDDGSAEAYSNGYGFGWLKTANKVLDYEGARASGVHASEMPFNPIPHRSGLDYVPYDDYPAVLHKGERVLTASDNRYYDEFSEKLLNTYVDSNVIESESNELSTVLNKNLDINNTKGITHEVNSLGSSMKNLDDFMTVTFKKLMNKSIDAISGLTTVISSIDLSLLLNSGTTPLGFSKSMSPDSMIKSTYDMIMSRESAGSYGSINYNDNGAVSVGRIQWHGDNARSLLSSIAQKDPSTYNSLASQYGISSNYLSSSWGNHIVSRGSNEDNFLKSVLTTNAGKAVQDEFAMNYIQSYIDQGKSYGLNDTAALMYFADFANQYGKGSQLLKTITQEAIRNGGTLDAMYNATLNHTNNYLDRRLDIYNELKGMSSLFDSYRGVSSVRQIMIEYAKSKLGTPYVWGGNGPDYYDCSGFITDILNQVGLNKNNKRYVVSTLINEGIQNISSESELIPGDILIGNGGLHTGIYVGDGIVIHSSGNSSNTVSNPGKGVTEGKFSSPYWYAKWTGEAYADGGKIVDPTVSLLGEGGYDEYVITTDPCYHYRSSSLLHQAASDIGVANLSHHLDELPADINVYIDVDGIIDAVATLTKVVTKGFKDLQDKSSVTYTKNSSSTNLITDLV